MLITCHPAPSSLGGEKVIQTISGSFFYLQQINEKCLLESRTIVNFLSYKATLLKTGEPVDSLLHIAIHY